MTEEQLYAIAYNAHEKAQEAALEAMCATLQESSLEALACLSDPEWRWETRSWMSATIVEYASEVLDEKLERLVA